MKEVFLFVFFVWSVGVCVCFSNPHIHLCQVYFQGWETTENVPPVSVLQERWKAPVPSLVPAVLSTCLLASPPEDKSPWKRYV